VGSPKVKVKAASPDAATPGRKGDVRPTRPNGQDRATESPAIPKAKGMPDATTVRHRPTKTRNAVHRVSKAPLTSRFGCRRILRMVRKGCWGAAQ
jgi:hypothetical protein